MKDLYRQEFRSNLDKVFQIKFPDRRISDDVWHTIEFYLAEKIDHLRVLEIARWSISIGENNADSVVKVFLKACWNHIKKEEIYTQGIDE